MEDWRRREGIRRPWLKDRPKYLNENLAPLRRFLQKNVGRPWDKVYSEVCQRINRNSAVQLHVWQHLRLEVCTDPNVVLGLVHRWSWPRHGSRFFVDPRSGLLREIRQRRRQHEASAHPHVDRIEIDDEREYRRIEGIWYELTLAPLPVNLPSYDMGLKQEFSTREDFLCFYGREVYAVNKRQLSKKEIRKLALGVKVRWSCRNY